MPSAGRRRKEIKEYIMKNYRTLAGSIVVAVVVSCAMVATAEADYADSIEALDPLAYWRLGESSGSTAVDSTGSGRNGRYHGVTLRRPGAIFGDSDTGVSVRGKGYIDVPHDSAMLMDDGTVQFQFMDTGTIRRAGLFTKDSYGFDSGGHLSVMIDGGRVKTRLQSRNANHYVSSNKISLNTWYTVTFTFGGDGMKLYMDGELVDTNAYAGGLGATCGGSGNTEPIAMVANTWQSGNGTVHSLRDQFSGVMDDVALFDYALSPDTVGNLHELASTGIPEPATLTLLLAGAMAVVRRRR